MDQSDIEQLTAIFAKLGYDISITKRETKQTEEKKEEIIPKKIKTEEKKDNEEVKKFCEINFNINFPLSTITEVKGVNAHEIYKWAKKNYGKPAVPKWNFYKILINKEGKIEDTFASFTKPMSGKLIKKIEGIL